MHYPDLSSLIADRKRALAHGPIALLLAEDDAALAQTIAYHSAMGFAAVIVFCAPALVLPAQGDTPLHRVDHDLGAPDALPKVINAISAAAAGQWIYYGYNAEFLMFPFCEYRNVIEMLRFVTEERRRSVQCCLVDLYPDDLTRAPDGVDLDNAHFDGAGYFATARYAPAQGHLERQVDIYGGLRWRFEQFIPYPRRRLDRGALFLADRGVQVGADGLFNIAEYNTYACPWHHNLTAAVCSFRAAKALRRNPDSRAAIDRMTWAQSRKFTWRSQQLMDHGLMEPGQWF